MPDVCSAWESEAHKRSPFTGNPWSWGRRGARTQTASRSRPLHPGCLSHSVSEQSCQLTVRKSGGPSEEPHGDGGVLCSRQQATPTFPNPIGTSEPSSGSGSPLRAVQQSCPGAPPSHYRDHESRHSWSGGHGKGAIPRCCDACLQRPAKATRIGLLFSPAKPGPGREDTAGTESESISFSLPTSQHTCTEGRRPRAGGSAQTFVPALTPLLHPKRFTGSPRARDSQMYP